MCCLLGSACYVPRTAHPGLYGYNNIPKDAGKCFAKCIIPDQKEMTYDTLGVYGVDEEIPTEKLVYTEQVPKTTKWVKKKAGNCMSSDPNDCLVWCLQEVEGQGKERVATVSIDTTGDETVQYVIGTHEKVTAQGGFTEWVEVLCEKDIYPEIYQAIRLALTARGFACESADKEVVKKVLLNFQEASGLPYGQLDIYTMEALGISR